MRAIYLIFFWGIILLFFWLVPRNLGIIKANEAFYLKEYYLRFLINLKELENNTLVDLAERINYSGCKGAEESLELEKLRKLYDEFYKKEQFDVIFGIGISNSYNNSCYLYNSSMGICFCFFENFERALNPGEAIEVREANTVSIHANISERDLKVVRIGIGYYKKWMK